LPSESPNNTSGNNPLTDRALRRTIIDCINRDEINRRVLFNLFPVPHGIINFTHEEMAVNKIEDPEQSQNEQPEFFDNQSRVEPVALTILVEEEDMLKSVAAIMKDNLEICGIDLQIRDVPQEIFWAVTGRDSIFQANDHMALIAWPGLINQPCQMFTSDAIPNSNNQYTGLNFSGYHTSELDDLCIKYQSSGFQSDRRSLLVEMEKLLKQDIPVFPVYQISSLVITRRDFCDIQIDTENLNDLTKIETFHYGDECR